MGRFRGIVFGWEGVLVDTREAYFYSVNSVLRVHGYPQLGRETFDLLFVKGSVRMFISLGHVAEAEMLTSERREEYNRVVEHFAMKKDDSAGLLQELKARGYLVAIATNSHLGPLERLMDDFGMRPFVDAVVPLEEALVAKPNPHMVSLACEKLGLRPDECALVGDRTIDMEAGKKAGTYCIGVAEREDCVVALAGAGADVTVSGISQILQVLE